MWRRLIKFNPWDRFWKLTVVWEMERRWRNRIYEKCICDCWTEKRIEHYNLAHNKIKSCWCICHTISVENWRRRKTHWKCRTKIYKKYQSAKSRCKNHKETSYKNYWKRWIRFLRKSFEEFYKDMWASYEEHVKKYWERDTTLDRINPNWNYCKENCRWATIKEQQNNRTNNHGIEYDWKQYASISQLSDVLWIKYKTLRFRIKHNKL